MAAPQVSKRMTDAKDAGFTITLEEVRFFFAFGMFEICGHFLISSLSLFESLNSVGKQPATKYFSKQWNRYVKLGTFKYG